MQLAEKAVLNAAMELEGPQSIGEFYERKIFDSWPPVPRRWTLMLSPAKWTHPTECSMRGVGLNNTGNQHLQHDLQMASLGLSQTDKKRLKRRGNLSFLANRNHLWDAPGPYKPPAQPTLGCSPPHLSCWSPSPANCV